MPLDWNYKLQLYALVFFGVACTIGGGLELLLQDQWWLRVLGGVAFPIGCFFAYLLLTWVRKPVDAEALADMKRRDDELRIFTKRRGSDD